MKKLILFLIGLFVCTQAWAVPDMLIANQYSGSTEVSSVPSIVCSVTVTGVGVAVGDTIELQNNQNTQSTKTYD